MYHHQEEKKEEDAEDSLNYIGVIYFIVSYIIYIRARYRVYYVHSPLADSPSRRGRSRSNLLFFLFLRYIYI